MRNHSRPADFVALAEHSPDVIARIDRAGRHLYVNAAAERATGMPAAAFDGRRHAELGMPPEVVALFERHLQAAFDTGAPQSFTFDYPTPAGARRFEVRLVPEWDSASGLTPDDATVLAIGRDFTEQHEAQAALRESEERFRQMAAHIPDVFWLTDVATRRLLYASPAFEALWGIGLDALYDDLGVLAGHIHPDDRDATLAAFGEMWQERRSTHEYRIVRPDGTTRWVSTRVVPVHDGSGRAYRHAGITSDVTAARRAEEALRERDERLRHAQKMEAVGQLAGGVAHDFNNLLTVISANLEFVRDELAAALPSAHRVYDDLAEIGAASERARSLVRQLLTFSRRQPVRPRRVRVADVVAGAERLLRRVIGEEIALDVRLAGGDDGPTVRADPGHLEQVLLNLAVNARDAMLTARHGHPGTGGVLEIVVDTVPAPPPSAAARGALRAGRHARLRVRDTGHGMDAATAARVFDPFFTTKDVGSGTGLGLSTVFGIVQQAGGAVELESAPGAGTLFTVLLPTVDASEHADDADAAALPAAGPCRPAAVLLVEDEAPVRIAMRRLLERVGYAVREARHAGDALTLWREHAGELDVVVTDVRMPEMGGPQLVARLRAERPTLPAVFVTGYADTAAARQAAAAGMRTVFLEKPFADGELVAAVARVLEIA